MSDSEDYGGVGGTAAHAASHQDGGSDKVAVDALLGELAAEQKSSWAKVSGKPTTFAPAAHAASHQDGGSDKIAVDDLLGELAAEQKSSWVKVSGKPTTFPIAAHADSHQDGGDDEIAVDGLAGELTAEQKSSWTKVSGKPTTFTPLFASSAEIIAGTEAAKATAPDQLAIAKTAGYFGKLVQIQHAVVSAAVTGTTQMPLADSIPQITEGFEVVTCAITPKSVNNLLVIMANVDYTYSSGACSLSLALFRDAVAAALAAVSCGANDNTGPKTLIHNMIANTVSLITFRVRFGGNAAATIGINTVYGTTGRVYGGIAATTLTIFEYAP